MVPAVQHAAFTQGLPSLYFWPHFEVHAVTTGPPSLRYCSQPSPWVTLNTLLTLSARTALSSSEESLRDLIARLIFQSSGAHGHRSSCGGQGAQYQLFGTSSGSVQLTTSGNVASVVFNRPESRNAMTWAMYQRLNQICEQLQNDTSIRVVTFRGAGGQEWPRRRLGAWLVTAFRLAQT